MNAERLREIDHLLEGGHLYSDEMGELLAAMRSARKLARAVDLFYADPWSDDDLAEWRELTGREDAQDVSCEDLCNLADEVMR